MFNLTAFQYSGLKIYAEKSIIWLGRLLKKKYAQTNTLWILKYIIIQTEVSVIITQLTVMLSYIWYMGFVLYNNSGAEVSCP